MWPRGVHRPQPPAGQVGPVAVGQRKVGAGHHHEAAQLHGRVAQLRQVGGGRAGLLQPAGDPPQQVVRVLVAVGDERRVGRVQPDPGPRHLPHPARQAVVVRVQVGHQHAADVDQPGAERPQAVLQGGQRLRGVPAGIHQHHPAGALERVGEDIGQSSPRVTKTTGSLKAIRADIWVTRGLLWGVARDRDGDAPQARHDLLDGGKLVGSPLAGLHRATSIL